MFAARKRESLIIRESAGVEINPLLKRVVSYLDNESMWISLVIEDGDEFERVSPWAARTIMFASHVWTWRVIMLSCIWFLLTSLANFNMANIPLQLALIAASAYLSTSMRSLFRSSSNNENSGAARQFRLHPSMRTCLAYNCFDPFATAGAQLQAAKKNGSLRNSAVILNAYETGDAILKYIRANHDNFENSLAILDLRARSNSLSSFRSSGQSTSPGRLHHDLEMRTFAPTPGAVPMPMPRPGPPLSPRDILLESQQLDLLRLTINKPIVVVYNQISFLPLLAAVGVVSGMIYMICLWLSCPDVAFCILNAQSIPYSILMMMWIGGGVVLFCYWRICCGFLISAGTIMIAKLKISRLASTLQDQYRGLVMPTFEQEMEEYLLIQHMFRKISEFFQIHVIISSLFCLLLFVLGLYWGLYGEAIAYSLAMLVISSFLLLSILLSCTVANEIAQEIQLTLSRSKPGDFFLGGADASNDTAGEAGEAKNPRKVWQEIAEQNKIQYTVYGFAVTRAWLATVSLSIFTSVLALIIQRQLSG